jgi:cytochrome c biogenesis protein CcmG/thiol:disulfide interchange protein DsbE
MRRTSRWLAGLGVNAILFGAVMAFASATVGAAAPPLVVQELGGQTFDLASLRGQVVIMNFWATWCPPCRKEMPLLNDFYRRYHERGLEMIGVSVDRLHDRSDVQKVMRAFSYPAAMLNDAQADGFGTPPALPVTYVIDRNGIVRAKITPEATPLSEDRLAQMVLPLVAPSSQSHPEGATKAQSP